MPAFQSELARFVSARLRAAGDPKKARPMQAYMKTDMPFHGVANPGRAPIFREMNAKFPPAGRKQYEAGLRSLWQLPHREEKYAAISFALAHKPFMVSASLPLYERLVREGAWWDLVDPIATDLISPVYLQEREAVGPVIERWIDDADLWIRRTALLAHHRHKQATDSKQLFDHCLRRAEEKEFFIRKAIGWALRQYSYANPTSVRKFLLKNRERLSGLSFREGARGLVREGLMK